MNGLMRGPQVPELLGRFTRAAFDDVPCRCVEGPVTAVFRTQVDWVLSVS